MIIGITGYKRSGKDTLADIFVDEITPKIKRIALADAMKEFTSELLGIDLEFVENLKAAEDVRLLSWDNSPATMRTFLQNLGQGVKELTQDELIWCRILARQIEEGEGYVIPDIRFPFEAAFFKKFAEISGIPFVMIRVVRPELDTDDTHISETSISQVKDDFVIVNDGTIEDLRKKATERLVAYAEEHWL
jgi:hypothetical protein